MVWVIIQPKKTRNSSNYNGLGGVFLLCQECQEARLMNHPNHYNCLCFLTFQCYFDYGGQDDWAHWTALDLHSQNKH